MPTETGQKGLRGIGEYHIWYGTNMYFCALGGSISNLVQVWNARRLQTKQEQNLELISTKIHFKGIC